jgi:hypothetical protein
MVGLDLAFLQRSWKHAAGAVCLAPNAWEHLQLGAQCGMVLLPLFHFQSPLAFSLVFVVSALVTLQ